MTIALPEDDTGPEDDTHPGDHTGDAAGPVIEGTYIVADEIGTDDQETGPAPVVRGLPGVAAEFEPYAPQTRSGERRRRDRRRRDPMSGALFDLKA